MRRLLVVMSLCALLLTGLVGWVARASRGEPPFACLRGYSNLDYALDQEYTLDANQGYIAVDGRRRVPPNYALKYFWDRPFTYSPDGQKVLHLWSKRNSTQYSLEFSNIATDFSRTLLTSPDIFRNSENNFSPDSEQLAVAYSRLIYSNKHFYLLLVNIANQTFEHIYLNTLLPEPIEQVQEVKLLDWSADGRYIRIGVERERGIKTGYFWDVSEKQFTQYSLDLESWRNWAPVGNTFAVLEKQHLDIRTPDGNFVSRFSVESITKSSAYDWDISWSPNGQVLVIKGISGMVGVFFLSGRSNKFDQPHHYKFGAWSADSERLAIFERRTDNPQQFDWKILDLATGTFRIIHENVIPRSLEAGYPKPSTAIFFSTGNYETGFQEYLADADGQTIESLSSPHFYWHWSSDGRFINGWSDSDPKVFIFADTLTYRVSRLSRQNGIMYSYGYMYKGKEQLLFFQQDNEGYSLHTLRLGTDISNELLRFTADSTSLFPRIYLNQSISIYAENGGEILAWTPDFSQLARWRYDTPHSTLSIEDAEGTLLREFRLPPIKLTALFWAACQ